MERSEVAQLLGTIAEDYGAEISTNTINAWYRHLESKDSEKVRMAYSRFFDDDSRGRMPTISQICSVYKTIDTSKKLWTSDRPPLHYNQFGELEDAEGMVYADPAWTEEDYKHNREVYALRHGATPRQVAQVKHDVEQLIINTAALLDGNKKIYG